VDPAERAPCQFTGSKLTHKPLDLLPGAPRRGLLLRVPSSAYFSKILPEIVGGVSETHTLYYSGKQAPMHCQVSARERRSFPKPNAFHHCSMG
jgi:hypothetical protein